MELQPDYTTGCYHPYTSRVTCNNIQQQQQHTVNTSTALPEPHTRPCRTVSWSTKACHSSRLQHGHARAMVAMCSPQPCMKPESCQRLQPDMPKQHKPWLLSLNHMDGPIRNSTQLGQKVTRNSHTTSLQYSTRVRSHPKAFFTTSTKLCTPRGQTDEWAHVFDAHNHTEQHRQHHTAQHTTGHVPDHAASLDTKTVTKASNHSSNSLLHARCV